MKTTARLLLGLLILTLVGCTSLNNPPSSAGGVTPAERAAMQTRVMAAPLDTVFAASVAVLQERGWNILKADRASGLIQAESNRRVETLSPKEESLTDLKKRQQIVGKRDSAADQWSRWEDVTAHIEPWGSRVRARIILSRRGALPPMTYTKRIGSSFFSKGRLVTVNAPASEESVEVLFPEVYEELLGRIEKAIALRQSQP